MVDIFPKIAALLLIPPGVIIVTALIGFLIQIRWPVIGGCVVFISIVVLLILSLPLTNFLLVKNFEYRFPPLRFETVKKASGSSPGAIVILGGGRYPNAIEFGEGDDVRRAALERIRYGAYLHRKTGLPILVSGGAPFDDKVSEAKLLKTALSRDFRVPSRWVEGNSANTYENAKFSSRILFESGVRKIYLVTHATHMPRAVWSFEKMGISVIPAPMGFTTLEKQEFGLLGYFPSARALLLSSNVLHERLGLIWYKYKYESTESMPNISPVPIR